MGSQTNANGVYMDCGYGMPIAVTLTCGGPSCDSLNSINFPNLTCSPSSGGTQCTNGITCPGTPNFQSAFSLVQQAGQTTVTSTQNATVDAEGFSGTDPGTGQPFSFSALSPSSPPPSGCPAVPAIATSPTAATSTHPTLFTSAGNRRSVVPKRSYPNMMLILVMVMSFFITQIHAQSPTVVLGQIEGLFPPGNEAILFQAAQLFCQQTVYPQIDDIVAGQENRARGVVDLVAACVSLLDSVEIENNVAGNDPSTAFGLALGNLLVCDKLSNTFLEKGGSELCNVILAPESTSTVTTTVPSPTTITAVLTVTVTEFATTVPPPKTITTIVSVPETVEVSVTEIESTRVVVTTELTSIRTITEFTNGVPVEETITTTIRVPTTVDVFLTTIKPTTVVVTSELTSIHIITEFTTIVPPPEVITSIVRIPTTVEVPVTTTKSTTVVVTSELTTTHTITEPTTTTKSVTTTTSITITHTSVRTTTLPASTITDTVTTTKTKEELTTTTFDETKTVTKTVDFTCTVTVTPPCPPCSKNYCPPPSHAPPPPSHYPPSPSHGHRRF